MELKPEPEMRPTYDPEAQLLWQKLVWNNRFAAGPVAELVVFIWIRSFWPHPGFLIFTYKIYQHTIYIKTKFRVKKKVEIQEGTRIKGCFQIGFGLISCKLFSWIVKPDRFFGGSDPVKPERIYNIFSLVHPDGMFINFYPHDIAGSPRWRKQGWGRGWRTSRALSPTSKSCCSVSVLMFKQCQE